MLKQIPILHKLFLINEFQDISIENEEALILYVSNR